MDKRTGKKKKAEKKPAVKETTIPGAKNSTPSNKK